MKFTRFASISCYKIFNGRRTIPSVWSQKQMSFETVLISSDIDSGCVKGTDGQIVSAGLTDTLIILRCLLYLCRALKPAVR